MLSRVRAIRPDSLLTLFGLSIIPAVYSCILLCLSYPFIGSTDGWSRWMTALIIADGVNLPGYFWSDIFPPLLSILLAVSNMLSGEYGFFTFMQIFVVCFALSLVLWKALPGGQLIAKWIAYVVCLTLLLANPFVLNRLAQVYPEPLLTVGLLMLSLLLYKGRDMSISTFVTLILLTIFFTVGLRYNALVVTIPFLLMATARAFGGGASTVYSL